MAGALIHRPCGFLSERHPFVCRKMCRHNYTGLRDLCSDYKETDDYTTEYEGWLVSTWDNEKHDDDTFCFRRLHSKQDLIGLCRVLFSHCMVLKDRVKRMKKKSIERHGPEREFTSLIETH